MFAFSLLFVFVTGRKVVLLNCVNQPVDLVFVRNRTVFKPVGPVDAHATISSSGHKHRSRLGELDDGTRSAVFAVFSLGVGVEMAVPWVKRVAMQIPNFNTTVVGDRGKHRGSEGGPADIVDLFLEGDADLLAHLLFVAVLVMPDANGPIVGTSQEDGALD